jgi:hypothetical protein
VGDVEAIIGERDAGTDPHADARGRNLGDLESRGGGGAVREEARCGEVIRITTATAQTKTIANAIEAEARGDGERRLQIITTPRGGIP